MIDLQHVSKSYGTNLVVDDVTLRLADGGITSLVGPNGAGKSTLLSMIARLLGTDAGTITVGGLDVSRADTRELARTLAVLKQDNHLVTRLSVEDLVLLGRYPHSQGRLTARDREKVSSALEFMDLTDVAGRFTDELSGGQRQRAFVAMVLAQDTRYLLLDEPLNNLDMAHARSMMSRLRTTASEGTTVVLVVHDINMASCWSDRVVAMKDGRVVAQGTPSEVVTPRLMRDVFDLDAPVVDVEGYPIVQHYLPGGVR